MTGRKKRLKMLLLRRFCPTQACTTPQLHPPWGTPPHSTQLPLMALQCHHPLTMPRQGNGARGKSSALCAATNAPRSLQPALAAIPQKLPHRRCKDSLLPPQAVMPSFGELPIPPVITLACSMSPAPLLCVPSPGAVVVVVDCSSCPPQFVIVEMLFVVGLVVKGS